LNRSAIVLLAKYAITFVLAAAVFILAGGNPWGWVFAMSITVATLNYLLGDFYVLPRYGNIVSSVANGFLAGLGAYLVSSFFPAFGAGYGSIFTFGILIAVGEYFFHRYLMQTEETRPS